jgi:IS5 family transposase
MSFLDGALAKRRGQKPDALAEIDSLVDWAPFERLLGDIHNAAKGEAAYPPLLMFKVVLLQRWHNLTDPAMELALYDRISFLRFAGLSAEDETPDHATIWRFRQKLAEVGLMDRLFEELRRQLESRGMTIK